MNFRTDVRPIGFGPYNSAFVLKCRVHCIYMEPDELTSRINSVTYFSSDI